MIQSYTTPTQRSTQRSTQRTTQCTTQRTTQRTTTNYNKLQQTTTHYNALQRTTMQYIKYGKYSCYGFLQIFCILNKILGLYGRMF